MHDPAILSQPVLVRDWKPVLPAGTLRAVILHWTAGDYTTTFPAYHFCLSGALDVMVHATHDLRANMRDLRVPGTPAYAAHTQGRNSFAVGIAVCAMRAALPDDFAAHPVTPAQIDALCAVTAQLVRTYGIALDAVCTHAEAAVADGYFGCGGENVRWDLARLEPRPAPLSPGDARVTGERLRALIAARC